MNTKEENQNNKGHFSFRETEMSKGVLHFLRQEAKKEGRSLNNWIGLILSRYMNEKKRKKK